MRVPKKVQDDIAAALKAGTATERRSGLIEAMSAGSAPTFANESDFQQYVIALANTRGWRVAHFRKSRSKKGWLTAVAAQGKGFPDLLCIRGDRLFVAELKVPPNKPFLEQRQWLEAFLSAGVMSYIWFPKDLSTIERTLT